MLSSCCTTVKYLEYDSKYINGKVFHDEAIKYCDYLPKNDSLHNYSLVMLKEFFYLSNEYLLEALKNYNEDVYEMLADNYFYLTLIELELYKNNKGREYLNVIDNNLHYFKDYIYKPNYHGDKFQKEEIDALSIMVAENKNPSYIDSNNKYSDKNIIKNFVICTLKNLPYFNIIQDIPDIINYKEDFINIVKKGINSKEHEFLKNELKDKLIRKSLKRIANNIIFIIEIYNCLEEAK